MICLGIKYTLCLHCFKFFFFFFLFIFLTIHSLTSLASSRTVTLPEPKAGLHLLPLASHLWFFHISETLKLCNVYHFVQNYYKFQLFFISHRSRVVWQTILILPLFLFTSQKKKNYTFYITSIIFFYYHSNKKTHYKIKYFHFFIKHC